MFKNWYDNESAIFCIFYKLNKEKSQDGWVKQLHQSECPNIFLQNALNSSFRTFRGQHVVNDIRIAIQATFRCFHVVFSVATIRVCIWKFLFSILESGEGWECFEDSYQLPTAYPSWEPLWFFSRRLKRKQNTRKFVSKERWYLLQVMSGLKFGIIPSGPILYQHNSWANSVLFPICKLTTDWPLYGKF